MRNSSKILVEKLEERENLGDLGTDERILQNILLHILGQCVLLSYVSS
jgi:hypothetical protein